jgi:hypothetical protein
MRPRGILQYAISLTCILLILAGCAILPEPPTASPSATPADAQPTTSPTPEPVEPYCKIIVLVTVEAYIDHNENGKREAWEDPLQDARFRVEWRNPKESPKSDKEVFYVESDATGQAQYDVLVDCLDSSGDLGTVYAEVPPDYRLTTPDHCSNGDCIFGFAALRVTPIGVREADLRGADLRGTDLRGEDLRDADLTGARLREADLRGAKLGSAELSGADLQEADLMDADLTGVILCEANLRGAKLRNAELSGADLQGADLSGADLQGANLSDASLHSANLSAANLSGANLSNANLQEAKYDRDTQWPEGFDPFAAGAVLEE